MSALTAARNTLRQGQSQFRRSVVLASGAKVFQGGIVVEASGLGAAASTATGLTVMGVACASVDNTAGGLSVDCDSGIFKMDNSASADQILQADVGNNCYLVDDHTVAKTNGTSTRSVAGVIWRIDADGGVWVTLGQAL